MYRIIQICFLVIIFLCNLPLSAQETLGIGVPYLPKKLNLTQTDDLISSAILANVSSHFGEGKEKTSSTSHRRRETELGQEWIFEYRPNISLNETTNFTPQSIIDSIEYFKNDPSKPEYQELASSLSNIRSLQYHRDYTPNSLNISLKTPDANFPKILELIPLINTRLAHLFKDRIGEGTNMPTYGPFIIKDYRPNEQIILSRNKHFGLNDNPEGYEIVQFKIFSEPGERLRSLRTGSILIILIPTLEELTDASTDTTLDIIDSPLANKKTSAFDITGSDKGKIILRKSLSIDNNLRNYFKLEGIKRGE